MTDKQKNDRIAELYDGAISRFLEKMDWDFTDWLSDEDLKEYCELYKEVNEECPLCGEAPEDCECKY